MALVGLVAIAPTFIGMVAPELYALRIIRLIRIGRLGRSDAFRKSIARFHHVISSRRRDLTISTVYTSVVLSISSVLMYTAEGGVQPDQFGSVLRCLWWSVITVITIGYGNVYPVTASGRLIASATAQPQPTSISGHGNTPSGLHSGPSQGQHRLLLTLPKAEVL